MSGKKNAQYIYSCDGAVFQQSNATRVSVCPRVVTLDQHGKTSRMLVRICNMTAKAIMVIPKTNICELTIRTEDFKPK